MPQEEDTEFQEEQARQQFLEGEKRETARVVHKLMPPLLPDIVVLKRALSGKHLQSHLHNNNKNKRSVLAKTLH